jgi:uncharacterized protein (DUF983 family)
MLLGLKRGALHRCPNCGQGKLYRRYLKIQACPVCGHDNAAYPADDAPPYFTILIVGHVVVAPLLLFPVIWTAPTGLVLAVVMPLLAGLTLTVLPTVKGAVVGALWSLGGRAEPKPTI